MRDYDVTTKGTEYHITPRNGQVRFWLERHFAGSVWQNRALVVASESARDVFAKLTQAGFRT